MNTIFRILAILTIACLVAGAVYLAVENSNLASSLGAEPGLEAGSIVEPPQQLTTDSNTSSSFQTMAPPDGGGDHDSASLSRGLADVAGSLTKLSIITAAVLLLQFLFSRLSRLRLKPTRLASA